MVRVGTSDVMLGLVAGGVALTVLYLLSEIVSGRRIKAADQSAALRLLELYKKLQASGTKLHSRTKPYLDRGKRIKRPV
jgi:hypothetical protein